MDVNCGMSNNNDGDSQNKRAGQAARSTIEQCPRCYSLNTKFCYFNNYSLNQPRHYCRSCKRHWTKGGALRDVPVGGNRYKNRKARVPPNLNGALIQAAVQQHHARVASAAISIAGARAMHGRNGGRFINFSNPFDARFSSFRHSAMASYAPMPMPSASAHAAVMAASNRSFLQELNNKRSYNYNNVVGNNNVSLGFGNFPPLQPISGAGAWQEESLMMRSNPSDHMLCWGFDDASGSGLNNDGGIGGLPNMNDIDFFDSSIWADDLPDFNPPPPPPSA